MQSYWYADPCLPYILTLIFYLLTWRTCHGLYIIITDFGGVECSSHFPFKEQTDRQHHGTSDLGYHWMAHSNAAFSTCYASKKIKWTFYIHSRPNYGIKRQKHDNTECTSWHTCTELPIFLHSLCGLAHASKGFQTTSFICIFAY